MDHRVLGWLGLVERMDKYPSTRRVLIKKVSRERVLGRPRLRMVRFRMVPHSGKD